MPRLIVKSQLNATGSEFYPALLPKFTRTGTGEGKTPLHRAAMAGRLEAVRVLLANGASLNDLDGMFAASPLVWATEGWRHPPEGADHIGVARLLIAAGSPLTWTPPEGAPDPEGTLEKLEELCKAAMSSEL